MSLRKRAADEQGRALRDPDSTTYVGAIEEAAAFGARIYTEAARRGATRAPRLWFWETVLPGSGDRREHFHQAIQIVDLYHAASACSSWAKPSWEETLPRSSRGSDLIRSCWIAETSKPS